MRTLVSFFLASALLAADDRGKQAQEWKNAGVSLQAQGKHSEAERAYLRAIRIAEDDPANWQVLVAAIDNLATLLLERGANPSRAVQLLRRALDISLAGGGSDAPEQGRVLMQMGAALMEQGRLGEAYSYFNQALPKVREDRAATAALQSNLGVLAYRQHRRPEAISHFLQSITAAEGGPQAVRSLSNLGAIYVELGQNADAETVLQKAVEAAQTTPHDNAALGQILKNYALALRRNGKKDESRRAKERANALSPSPDYTVHVSDLVKK